MSFVQLEVTTTNTLMKSTLTIEELIKSAKDRGYQAISLTDRNVMYGAIDFYEAAQKYGIKAIIGLKLDIQSDLEKGSKYPLILLAKNNQGYHDLIRLSTKYQLSENNEVYLSDLKEKADNLFVISPGEESEFISVYNHDSQSKALDLLNQYMEYFPSFYQGISLQSYNQNQVQWLRKMKIPIVSLGNIQYLNAEDDFPSRVLKILSSDLTLEEANQEKINSYLYEEQKDYSLYSANDFYLKFKNLNLEDAAKETENIAKNISLKLDLNQHKMPSYPLDKGQDSDVYLRKLCEGKLAERIDNVNSAYISRLDKELTVISDMGFSDYFLIVWDIILFAHRQNIYTGSGRGSAAGSLVSYLLGITNVDPIKFDLLFERFLNKERENLPDIDLDFPDNRREEIINYIYERYGRGNTAQIGTIGKFGAKSAVRDVGRVLGISQEALKKWSQAIPSGPNVNLKKAASYTKLAELINKNDLNRQIYQTALKIEGSNRHISTHAAGIVISDEETVSQVPLQKGNSKMHLTQYTMDGVEKSGLLKLDILGLKNLARLSDCINFIPYENQGKVIDIDAIDFNEKKTLEIFKKADTDGIFQFESTGIRRELRKLQADSFEEIIAINALYRPGPMDQIDRFIKRKNGEEEIQYPHEDLEGILKNTYGIIVYQEQVMKVAQKIAGYTLSQADILRRAIGKKDHEAIEKGRLEFMGGASKKGYKKETANAIYNYIEKFADYGFNRSHAVAYSKLAYQLAYVKANYPASFFAAMMKSSGKKKIQSYLSEARRREVKIIAPNINKSFYSFMIEDGKILSGFNMIKGVAKDFISEIIDERKKNGNFKGFIDFCKRVDSRWLTKEQISPFIYSGAMDGLEKNRNTLIYSLENVLENIQMSHGNKQLFQLFTPKIIEQDKLDKETMMEQEFEATGLYFTSEPGEKYKSLRKNKRIAYISNAPNGKKVRLLVVVKNIKKIQTKNGKPMSFIDAVDTSGKVNLTLFPENHRRYIQKISLNDSIVVEGKIEEDDRGLRLIVNTMIKAERLMENSGIKNSKENIHSVVYIRFESLSEEKEKFLALQHLLKEYPGKSRVIIYDNQRARQNILKKEYSVNIQSNLVNKLKKMFGANNLHIKNKTELF